MVIQRAMLVSKHNQVLGNGLLMSPTGRLMYTFGDSLTSTGQTIVS